MTDENRDRAQNLERLLMQEIDPHSVEGRALLASDPALKSEYEALLLMEERLDGAARWEEDIFAGLEPQEEHREVADATLRRLWSERGGASVSENSPPSGPRPWRRRLMAIALAAAAFSVFVVFRPPGPVSTRPMLGPEETGLVPVSPVNASDSLTTFSWKASALLGAEQHYRLVLRVLEPAGAAFRSGELEATSYTLTPSDRRKVGELRRVRWRVELWDDYRLDDPREASAWVEALRRE